VAVNNVAILGGDNHLFVSAKNLTGDDPLEFETGAFRSSPEERRVAVLFLITGGGSKVFKLRLEFSSPDFVEHNITGKSLFDDAPNMGVQAH